MKHFYILLIWVVFISCKNEDVKVSITNPETYNSYLSTSNHKTFARAFSEKAFWSKRLRPDSTGVGDLGPLANAYTLLFETTGDINYLKSAEILLKKAVSISATSKDSYTRSLAQNFISQHRFKEAKQILEKSYKGISNKRATQLLLFDVFLELGEYDNANEIIGKLKNTNDYSYLIRLAKWNDHNGNLDAAIRNLEKAKKIAESRKSKPLQIWTYTNLADFYGHAGRIKESYDLYLKTLQLQADHAYAKKQIAWIAYSYEKNTKEASRILDSVLIQHKAPEYYLMKAEMSEYNGVISDSKKYRENFIATINNGHYGQMYNNYLIEFYANENPEKALEIATAEIKNRATPEVYSLLAYAQLKVGNKAKALEITINFVEGKTFEPKSMYYSALIYKENNRRDKVASIKSELQNSFFELGPIYIKKIRDL